MRKIQLVPLVLTLLGGAGIASSAEVPDGRVLFRTHCQRCHGADGKAPPSYAKKGTPDLNDPDWQGMRSDAEVLKSITDGSEGTIMDGFKDTLKPAEIDAVVGYIRTWRAAK